MFIVLKIKIADQMKPYKISNVVIMKWLLEAVASANFEDYTTSEKVYYSVYRF